MSRLLALICAGLAGCGAAGVTPRPADALTVSPPQLGAAHDPSKCGTIGGRVTFAGSGPIVLTLLGALPDGEGYRWVTKPNPFAPIVGKDGGFANVLIWLDGIDPAKSRPWDMPSLHLDIQDAEFRHDGKPFVAGVAPTGGELAVTSRDAAFYSLRARGAAFFALPFPAQNTTVTHALPHPGIVEMSCATTAYWMAADVLVHNNPYATVTDDQGRYTFGLVPPGEYTLNYRARNWKVARTERDPETGLHARQYYFPPAVKTVTIKVGVNTVTNHSVTFAPSDFRDTE